MEIAIEQPEISGLEGVVVGRTRLSHVDGDAGRLTVLGYAIEELAPQVSFEQMAYLLLHGQLPNNAQAHDWQQALAGARTLSSQTRQSLQAAANAGAAPMTALRVGLGSVALARPDAARLLAAVPTIVTTFDRLRQGLEPVPPDPALGLAADLLRMRTGTAPTPAATRALNTYLNTVADHGLNASAFTARVVASTGASLASAIEAGLCALEGPLHGGAPGPALQALQTLRKSGGNLGERTQAWVREQVGCGARIMGFGHRVYRVRDPRAVVLRTAAEQLLGANALLRDAQIHEQAVLETLAKLKPGRPIATNVEFSTALLLHALDVPTDLFTPIFAVARTAGWIAHVAEQQAHGRLIRPRLAYVGAQGLHIPPASGAAQTTHAPKIDPNATA